MRNTICVGASLLAIAVCQSTNMSLIDRSHALRGNASRDAPRSNGTQSVPGCVPTRSVGTINTSRLQMKHPTVGFHTIGKVFVYSEKVGAKASQP